MTSGIDNTLEMGLKLKMIKGTLQNSSIQFRRERSHPKEKSEQGATDSTPKRYLVIDRQIVD